MKPRRPKAWLGYLWFIVALFVAVMLNGVVRPLMAHWLGGERVERGASSRGGDVYWVFDAATQREHPVATTFLGWSHGQIGLVTLAVILVCGVGGWIVGAVTKAAKP
ncbi:hypothetical protein [Brevundimonas sp. SORGH_AS_0993]|uniref:hypothetical protein n=1 Tax=Brevundimonas sp. SORGH_AS_0993 TaxID=3041794 RepID=UPI00278A4076|nr:hypothetical protein [Brevundimonas sp. SORGH_AS_0993]MDQ1153789.1 hypothetical protein [Brevundimonas sp. SORGH_AS_0993]